MRPGFLLMEVLIGIAVFVAFLGGVGYTLLYGQSSTIMFGDHVRGVQAGLRAVEAARAIRDASFSSLVSGTYGTRVNPATGMWEFSGAQTTVTGGYTTTLVVTRLASDWARLTARTVWKHGYNRSGSVLLTSELTDWRSTRSIGNWNTAPDLEGSYTDAANPVFNDVALYSGSTVFVSAGSVDGLFAFNTAVLTSPSRISSSFSLGYAAYDVAVAGNYLYVATADPDAEIKIYAIPHPVTLAAGNLAGSINVPGSARVRALAVRGSMLYAGAVESADAGEDEFYVYRIGANGLLTQLDSLDDNGSVQRIAVSGTAAYLASTQDASELRVVDVESGSNVLLLGGYNLSDRTLDALSVAVSGTSALLGTQKGSGIQELVLFDVAGHPLPVPPPGPWYHEGSGSIVGIAMDPTRCYGFLAALSGRKALQIFHLRDKSSLAELQTYTSTTGFGRGVLYDLARDRVLLITDRSLLIFKPGSPAGTCP